MGLEAARVDGQTILVTGSTGGIGRETAIRLAGLGADVLVHGRDAGRGAAVLEEVRAAGDGRGRLFLADLADQDEVRRLATAVRAAVPRLDVLVNNAGIFVANRRLTPEGVELTFAVNVVAPFLLTRELLPLLRASCPARIVNLSSASHWTGEMHWRDLQLHDGYEPRVAYDQSKLAMTLLTLAVARRLDGSGVTAVCLDPGDVDTAMLRAGWPELPGISVAAGAATSVCLASSPQVAGVTGVYYEGGAATPPPAAALDAAAQDRLWVELERLAGPR